MATQRKTGFALATTAILWASAFPAIKVGLDGYGVAGLSFMRLLVASATLALAAPILKVRMPRRADLPLIALCGLTGMSAYQILLNWGELHVQAGTASLLVAVVAPVSSVLLAAAFLGERLTRRIVLGSLVAIAGSALIVLAGGRAGYTTAAWVVLGAAVVQGVYHFATKPLLRRYSPLEVACYAMWGGTVFLIPALPAALHDAATAGAGPTLSVVLLGVLPSAIGFVTWGYGVSHSTMSAATAVLYLVPVLALAVSFGWLGEVPTWAELAGGAISVAGVLLIRTKPAAGAASPAPAPSIRLFYDSDLR
jgi:drug/metabolite transporter (DMT)-like permease